MDYPVSHRQQAASIPWRALALVAGAVAAVELLLLIVVGSALLVNPDERGAERTRAKAAASAPAKQKQREKTAAKASVATKAKPQPTGPAPVAELPRRRVAVMVLNGNGITGAAAAAARRVSRRGYRIGTVGNAPTSDYTRSVVMYRRGFEGEGVRLARDLGVTIVGPLDGLRASDLHGAQAVFVIGS